MTEQTPDAPGGERAQDEPNWKAYARKLRLDASGEAGRMDSSDMYALADRLDALAASPRPAEPEPPKAEQEPTKKPEDCQHEVFRAQVGVGRMEDSGRFTADITVWCVECGEPFRFLGVDGGLSFREPRVSVDGLELRAPIEPQVTPRLIAHAAYEMPTIPRKN